MAKNQVCGHCRQSQHNRRTCEAYAKYCDVVEERDRLAAQLAEAEAENSENQAIIRGKNMTIQQLRDYVRECEDTIKQLRAQIGAFAFPGVGTGKGTSQLPGR
jgi:septal ring factor EnvC (AmiA/AmiB activator)